jgi:hypothetical protein
VDGADLAGRDHTVAALMTWRVARSVLALHAQLRAASRAAPPATPASAWGTISDAAHSLTSDHSPHDFPGWGNDIVTAGDFPDRPDLGLDARRVLDDIRRSRDPRVKYGISHGQMFSSYATSSFPAWAWRPYRGDDGHWTHGHLSVVGDARADGEQPWAIGPEEDMNQEQWETLQRVNLTLGWLIQGKEKTGDQPGLAKGTTFVIEPNRKLAALVAAAAADETRDQAVLAAVKALTVATGNDPQPILDAIAAAAADTHALVVQLQQQLADVQARSLRLAQALAAAGGALDDADDPAA